MKEGEIEDKNLVARIQIILLEKGAIRRTHPQDQHRLQSQIRHWAHPPGNI